LLLLLDYWPLERFGRRSVFYLIREKIPFFIFAAVSSAVTFLAQRSGGAVADAETFLLYDRFANALLSYARYIAKMFWPRNLAVFYPFNAAGIPFWQVAICALLLLVISVLVIRLGRNQKYLPVGWFWFLGTLIPVIGIVQVGSQAYADRYTYISYIGLFIMLAWLGLQLLPKWKYRKTVLGLSMVLVLTTLGICAHRQISYWNNGIALFSHAIDVTQNNWLAYNNLGVAYARFDRYSEAIDACQQAVKINPYYDEAYLNLGNAYVGLGRDTEAIDAYQQVVKIKPDYAQAYNNLGLAYDGLGRSSEAIDAYQQAVKIKPDYAEAHYNLGYVYSKLNRRSEAIDAYQQAVKIRPDYAQAYNNLGFVYGSLGRYRQEIEVYQQAIKIRPDYAEAHNNLGAAYANLGRYSEAIDAYRQAVRINPDYAEAHDNLGYAYLATGDKNSALAEYNILKSLNPRFADELLKHINK
jgi:tetratricopeptide (TPR) repeat protein